MEGIYSQPYMVKIIKENQSLSICTIDLNKVRKISIESANYRNQLNMLIMDPAIILHSINYNLLIIM